MSDKPIVEQAAEVVVKAVRLVMKERNLNYPDAAKWIARNDPLFFENYDRIRRLEQSIQESKRKQRRKSHG